MSIKKKGRWKGRRGGGRGRQEQETLCEHVFPLCLQGGLATAGRESRTSTS